MGTAQEAVALALMGGGLLGTFSSLCGTASSHGCEDLLSWMLKKKKCTVSFLKPGHILVIYHPTKAEEGKHKIWEQVVSYGEKGLAPAMLFVYIGRQMEFLS